ncbi:MAG: VOC family protein, partial [Vicinamibacterales bacterium]
EPGTPKPRAFTPWDGSPVDGTQQIRGLYGAQVWERRTMSTAAFLLTALGFTEIGTDGSTTRYGFENAVGVLDVIEKPDAGPGAWGGGCVHHLAWRVADDAEQIAVRRQVTSAGGQATEVIDRFWFKSVYFREPGGVLFEIATDGPGFAADEAPEHLGETLVLPPWLEPSRPAIERALPQLGPPSS